MKRTGVICPRCGKKTDQSPCEVCGYKFPNEEENDENKTEEETGEKTSEGVLS